MKVVFCSSEVTPFAKTGGLGDVCGALPIALEREGVEVAVLLPHYGFIDNKKFGIKRLSRNLSTTTIGKKVPVFFIENEKLFGRDGLYGDQYGDYMDNRDRFTFFCRRSLEVLKEIRFKADIVHCHDWHTGPVPALLKFAFNKDPFYRKMKSILTIHNLAYQGIFPKWDFFRMGLPDALFGMNGFEFYGDMNFMKGGILFSDRTTTVSPGYAKEIQAEEFGCGLDGVLRGLKKPVVGILNGIDYNVWSPEADRFLAKGYSPKTVFEGKKANKQKLQEIFRLKVDGDVPLFGFVARLSHQKGLDLIIESIEDVMKSDAQLVFLGTGDEQYHEVLKSMAARYPKKIAVDLEYNEAMAHLIFAGSDLFLMPSVFEPCGLSQMISLRYGTVPLVFKTGGLADTIAPLNAKGGRGNGFVFDRYTERDFVRTVQAAVGAFKNKKIFEKLVKKAFTYDFSWEKSAQEYKKLYKTCLSSG